MDEQTQKLCSMITQHMAATGMSQKDLAEQMGVRQATVSYWLTGKNHIKRHNALKIMEICGGTESPVEAFRTRVCEALMGCDDLSGEARVTAVRIVRGVE